MLSVAMKDKQNGGLGGTWIGKGTATVVDVVVHMIIEKNN